MIKKYNIKNYYFKFTLLIKYKKKYKSYKN